MASAYFSNLYNDLQKRDIVIKSVTKISKPEKIVLKEYQKITGDYFGFS